MIDPITKYILQEQEDLKESSIHSGFGHVIVTLTNGQFAVGASIAAAAILWMGVKLYSDYIDKTGKECKNFRVGSPRHTMCEKEVRIEGKKKQIEIISKKKSLCKNSKNPRKCNDKIDKKIQKLKNDIDKLKTSYNKAKVQAKAKGKI